MAKINTPNPANATEDAYAGRTVEDPYDYTAIGYIQTIIQAVFGPLEWMQEIIALSRARVATQQYYNAFSCSSGLAVGKPVYASGADTVAAADATTPEKARVIGWVRYKPTTTTCLISHFYKATGLSGLTINEPVYLQDDGSIGASAGTEERILGTAKSTTSAYCQADGLSPHASSGGGGGLSRTQAQQAAGLFIFPEMDLTVGATATLAVPIGGLIPQECGIELSELGGTITTQPEGSFGITGNDAKYHAALRTTDLTAQGLAEFYDSLDATGERETSLTFTVTDPAIGDSTIKGRPWFRGVPVA